MKRIAGSVIAATALVLTGCQQDSVPTGPQPDAVLSAAIASAQAGGRVFVVFDGEADPALVEQLGGQVVYSYHLVPAVAATAPGHVISQLAAHPRVVRVEPDGKVHIIEAELDNTWGVKHIGAGIVHGGGNKGNGVKIGILDTGIDYTHPDLDANFVGGYDFVNNDNDPMDDHGHGTHVAGTVAAEDDDYGVVGVAPEASLYALKVLSASGGGSWSDIIAALEWAVKNGIQVTNNSYGSSLNPGGTVKAAFDNSAAAGILHVAAAGNSGNPRGKGNNVGYPARFASVIAVAATDKNNKRASFSSTGDAVELAAPGVKINSTLLGGGYSGETWSGTSMASPHVAGTAALVIAAGVTHVRTQLQTTADDLGDSGRDPIYGFGLVDADEAAAYLGQPNDAPTVSITSPADDSSFESGATIVFGGMASDTEDGNLTASLVWTSSIDGQIGAGGSFSTTLSDGNHTITANVIDSGNKTGSASVSITVEAPPNDAPTVSITSPADELTFDSEATILFEGTASDTEDGALTASLDWTSSIDGPIGTGGSFSTMLSDGNHTITADVTDSGNKTGSASISITVGTPPDEPTSVSVYGITYATEGGKNKDKHLLITVALLDDLGDPVGGASVSIDLFRDASFVASGTATTGTDGTVTFTSKNANSGCYTTTVTGVTAAGLNWDEDTPTEEFCKE